MNDCVDCGRAILFQHPWPQRQGAERFCWIQFIDAMRAPEDGLRQATFKLFEDFLYSLFAGKNLTLNNTLGLDCSPTVLSYANCANKNFVAAAYCLIFSFVCGVNAQSINSTSRLRPIQQDGKWGYIDSTGKIVIKPQFVWAEEFSEGLAAIENEDGKHEQYFAGRA